MTSFCRQGWHRLDDIPHRITDQHTAATIASMINLKLDGFDSLDTYLPAPGRACMEMTTSMRSSGIPSSERCLRRANYSIPACPARDTSAAVGFCDHRVFYGAHVQDPTHSVINKSPQALSWFSANTVCSFHPSTTLGLPGQETDGSLPALI